MTEYGKLDDYISRLGLDYSAVFVPFSKSRNAKATIKSLSDYSINWKVTIKSLSNGFSITSDYMQGIGHLPEGMHETGLQRDTYAKVVEYACEQGRRCHWGYSLEYAIRSRTPLPQPDLKDVLYCLLMDAEAIDYAFEEWCSNYGYDDSRKAESVYQECLQTGLKLRKMLGEKHINKLRELYQDY